MNFDAFFRANYVGMCRYCASFGFNFEDAQEEIVDVLLKYFNTYTAALSETRTGRHLEMSVRRWASRRAMLNLSSRYRGRVHHTRTTPLTDAICDTLTTSDDPAEIVSLMQRVPAVHPILIGYEAHGGTVTARGENTSADRTRFCRERKKFLQTLSA